ncbi:MAG: non-canonical purine NTP pyrophosphatase [Phycisphaeraceae bacterium]|nr:non-canonical purine NTP pyrophosphatase [Phycisphaeraceae bacterium]MCB9847088.1 non-canonical purine NTP pyrophosphatase [Phycisphaeraceae bacterium]
MEEIVVATGNPHKLDEVSRVLSGIGVRAVSLNDVTLPDGSPAGGAPEPVEDAATFAGNAAIKACYYAALTDRVCLADDSGLEVDALGGEPGVLSARYAGVDGDRATRDAANNAKLIAAIRKVPEGERTARFVCAMCVADPDGAILAEARGEFAGTVITEPRGSNGFGYDPLLELPEGKTSAELAPEEKNARSHRGQATRLIAQKLAAMV